MEQEKSQEEERAALEFETLNPENWIDMTGGIPVANLEGEYHLEKPDIAGISHSAQDKDGSRIEKKVYNRQNGIILRAEVTGDKEKGSITASMRPEEEGLEDKLKKLGYVEDDTIEVPMTQGETIASPEWADRFSEPIDVVIDPELPKKWDRLQEKRAKELDLPYEAEYRKGYNEHYEKRKTKQAAEEAQESEEKVHAADDII